jgi:membrane protease YdiL (CAAX protease family)
VVPSERRGLQGGVAEGAPALLAGGLAAWFFLWLVISVAIVDEWLAENVFSWMPDTLLQFALVEEDEDSDAGVGVAVAFILIALFFNGIAGPIAEELYFRGHLLPRLARYGRWAPLINTTLFAVYHFFSPWRYPAILVGFLPVTWVAWRKRSVFVSLAAHMTINILTVLLLFASLTASD